MLKLAMIVGVAINAENKVPKPLIFKTGVALFRKP